ncbi:spore germination protein [Paenibacillus sp.]|uniref:spore germination protein n=1 Tax=Paenibacillus sp. TaxID=58172 RepID=UPI002D6E380E|nr:spore germination protein [Paenibacillus sp.]HZG86793.1 spore germination protein [Paenibacillus sp.]
MHQIKSEIGNSPDLVVRRFDFGVDRLQVAVVYLDGIVDKDTVNRYVIRSLMIDMDEEELNRLTQDHKPFDIIRSNALTVGQVEIASDWDGLLLSLLAGYTLILIEGQTEALACGTQGGETRAVSEPTSQVVIRGPKEAFTESIGTNVAMVRRRLKTPHLWVETMKLGKQGHTSIALMYVKDIVDDQTVQEIKKRLEIINIDYISGSGEIEQMIEDQSATPFPTIFNTERPDSVVGSLMEGRVAIFVDGTPFVLIAPSTFFMFFQAAEDYYQRPEVASVIRFLRYGALLISLFGPSIYIASITFHQEMIPTQLLVSLAAQRESVPFPAFVEALIMEVAFEILREAGIRMPRAIGQAVSIVGALVLGQAAVEAGLISSAMVIVVAITGISSFSTPSYDIALSFRLLRFLIMISAGFLGFYGIAIISIFILAHMCGLRSFGVPYMSPLGPFVAGDHKDTFFRFPFESMFKRPRSLHLKNKIRQNPPSEMSAEDASTGKGTK